MKTKLKKWWKSAVYIAKVVGFTALVFFTVDAIIDTHRSKAYVAELAAHATRLGLDRESRITEMSNFVTTMCVGARISKEQCFKGTTLYMSGVK